MLLPCNIGINLPTAPEAARLPIPLTRGCCTLGRRRFLKRAMRKIPLNNSASFALVSDRDYSLVKDFTWMLKLDRSKKLRYAATTAKGKYILMHRLIVPSSRLVDHRDFDGINNQRRNIRPCSRSQSAMNRRKLAGKSSRYKGVCWNVKDRKWHCNIEVNGRKTYLGSYDVEITAAKTYNRAAKRLFKAFACLNKI
jgi:hypothetical protein